MWNWMFSPYTLRGFAWFQSKCVGIKCIFEEAIANLDAKVRQAEVDVTEYLMEAQHLEQKLEENMGEYERMFTQGLKELHTEEQSYHG